MAFTPFTDNLALVEVLLLLGAAVLTYGGVLAWWAIRTNDPKALRGVLRGTAVPLGGLGVVATILALWGEMTWPFLVSDGLGGYNIFFFDALLLFGLVLLAYAVSAYLSVRLQYAGLFALVAGGVVAFYGWTGYTAHPAFTLDPFYTLMLYGAFGVSGALSFPATILVDHYLARAEAFQAPWHSTGPTDRAWVRGLGARGVQPVLVGGGPDTSGYSSAPSDELPYHVPGWVQGALLLFPLFMGLASIAALWYFGITLPGHLGTGPSGAP
jgi:uncharacterized membrane protein